jgi:uronate dehydrogenase
MKQRVMVTGSEGGVGRAVCKHLSNEGHTVYRFDRFAQSDLENAIVGDIANRDQVLEATHDMDAIIHLAATPDEADFLEELIEPNVRGLYNVCDAARENGVARLVLASSVQVVSK